MKRIVVGLTDALFVSVLTCSVGWAQATAQISGAVTDQTGAVPFAVLSLPAPCDEADPLALQATNSTTADQRGGQNVVIVRNMKMKPKEKVMNHSAFPTESPGWRECFISRNKSLSPNLSRRLYSYPISS